MDSEGLPGEPFHNPVWDQIISGNQIGKFGNLVLQNELVHSHMHHFPSDSCLADVVPKIPCFGSGFGHLDEPGCPSNFSQNQGFGNSADCQENHHQNSPNGKRKRKNIEEHLKEDEEKKNICPNAPGRQGIKQAKDNSIEAEPSKENYIHVRAKRGQATNSHSLAERVRRERISERMKMLQELVPGCNKITGKAVMLDEIINYVQSLQQQVEFLSMKLATVNPELNADIQNILSKDIMRSQSHNNPGLSSTHPLLDLPQGVVDGFPGCSFQPHVLPQNLWNGELQSVLQMGFGSLGPNGDQQI